MFAVKTATDSKKQKSDQNKKKRYQKAKISHAIKKTRLTARKKSNEKTTEMRKKVVAENWKREGGG